MVYHERAIEVSGEALLDRGRLRRGGVRRADDGLGARLEGADHQRLVGAPQLVDLGEVGGRLGLVVVVGERGRALEAHLGAGARDRVAQRDRGDRRDDRPSGLGGLGLGGLDRLVRLGLVGVLVLAPGQPVGEEADPPRQRRPRVGQHRRRRGLGV